MKLGIELSNIRVGGGVTHILEILKTARPEAFGISEVTVWGGERVLRLLPEKPWLRKRHESMLDGALPSRALWQRRILPRLARQGGDILFSPGGSGTSAVRPYVTMSQNLLPFDMREMARYGVSWMFFRLLLLRHLQTQSFRAGKGVIFLSRYAREKVLQSTGDLEGDTPVISHGISKSFFQKPKDQKSIRAYSDKRPFRFLYVSTVDVYKHQWRVVEAIASLRRNGYPVMLDIVGGAYPPALHRLKKAMTRFDPDGRFIRYRGPDSYETICRHYHQADAFVFASTCETFGQVLLEAMAAGLPIACSDREPMTEIMGRDGIFFPPGDPSDIAAKLQLLLDDASLRGRLAATGFTRAQTYSWERCADDTFAFLARAIGNGRGA